MIPNIFLDFIRSFSNTKLETECCPVITSAKEAIYQTIWEYHKVSARKSLQTPDPVIQKICEYAAKILLKPDGYYVLDGNVPFPHERRGDPFKTQFNFRASWLRTASLCLDSTQESVIQILPYLLYCYTLNSGKNKIDCFDPEIEFTEIGKSIEVSNRKEIEGMFGTAFTEIFVPIQSELSTEPMNLRRNAKSLCNHFFSTQAISFDFREPKPNHEGCKKQALSSTTSAPPKGSESMQGSQAKRSLLSQLDLDSQIELARIYGQNRITEKEALSARKRQEQIVRFYELCRRFLAFVNACVALQNEVEAPINLSLSFALFCKTITVVCGAEGTHKPFFEPARWQDIMADKYRAELVVLSEWIPESKSISWRRKPKSLHGKYRKKILYLLRHCNVYSLAYESKCKLLDLYQHSTYF